MAAQLPVGAKGARMSPAKPKPTYTIERLRAERKAGDGDIPERPAVEDEPVSAVSNEELMAAIQELHAEVRRRAGAEDAAEASIPNPEGTPLEDFGLEREVQIEIARMVRMIANAKMELATIRHPMGGGEDDRLLDASSQLEVIIPATEKATHEILEATEEVEKILNEIGELTRDDTEVQHLAEKAGMHLVSVLEACNFQDITGQRINKVIGTMRFLEERIAALIDIWGADAFTDLPVAQAGAEVSEDESLLNGPQLENEGISQNEIDALFA